MDWAARASLGARTTPVDPLQSSFRRLPENVESLVDPDEPDLSADHALLPWGKAYAHGRDMGRRETHEVMEVT